MCIKSRQQLTRRKKSDRCSRNRLERYKISHAQSQVTFRYVDKLSSPRDGGVLLQLTVPQKQTLPLQSILFVVLKKVS
jgi:hypothetical protein